MKRLLNVVFLLVFFTGCESSNDFSAVRSTIEKTEDLIKDYRFCMYEKDAVVMERNMRVFIQDLEEEDALFTYFESKGIRKREIISSILVRNLCRTHEYMRRPIEKLSDEQLIKILDSSTEEIFNQINGVYMHTR